MSPTERYQIEVTASAEFVAGQSRPEDDHYVFAYHITVRNTGTIAAQLIARHWVITDANGKVQEVRGDGVIGEQPWLCPGEHFEYSSGAVLETAHGTMQGSYGMLADDGTRFDAPIAIFSLSIPRTVH